MGSNEMIINWIPLKSLMIFCLMVIVVVLVKLVVEAGQFLLQVYWCTSLSHLHHIEVFPPDPSTSSYPIRYYSWG